MTKRFIPACAANSGIPFIAPILRSVHPRLRGELCKLNDKNVIRYGSSPLARRTLIVNFCSD